MARTAVRADPAGEEHLKVVHPACGRFVLVLRVSASRPFEKDAERRGGMRLRVEGICYTCDRYVYLGIPVQGGGKH
jgi:hypothetical protein